MLEALTVTASFNFRNFCWVTGSSFKNSSLAFAAILTSRVAAHVVSANFSIGLEGTPYFFNVFCMALTDIVGPDAGQAKPIGEPRMLMAGCSTWLTGLKNTARTKPTRKGRTKNAFPLQKVPRGIVSWPRDNGSARTAAMVPG